MLCGNVFQRLAGVVYVELECTLNLIAPGQEYPLKSVAPFEIGITVSDIDAILPFYRDLLGFTVLSDILVPAEKSQLTGLSPDGYRVVRLESDGGDRIKFAQPGKAPVTAPAKAYALERQGSHYATYIVAELDALHARLLQAGIKLDSQGMVEVRAGLRMMVIRDPEGNYIEFVEYADLDAYRPAAKQ
ncbi:MAG: VOC family protein [Rhodocyclaceae bacterium]|nr:MAG: VOC family protein [Rhodocyclaceae bacterium]